MGYDEVFARHEKVALQFSGGKDSLVCLYLMRDYWDRLTVYFCDSGNMMPETLDLVDQISHLVPNFVTIKGHQPEFVKEYGFPSDLMPYASTSWGRANAGDSGPKMTDRYQCCAVSIMFPMHDRMKQDGVTLIIRGQRNDDRQKSPIRSGVTQDGIEFLFPIEDWSAKDVMAYLNQNMIHIPRFYQAGMKNAPDCINCTAWLEHGLPKYLKKYHPVEYVLQQGRLREMARNIAPVYNLLTAALEEHVDEPV
jgi:phosphoadenosine phosphosulfate reductase